MNMSCNVCGSPEFKDVNTRLNALCARCGAYERTRVMKFFIDKLELPPTAQVLHLAPERGLYSFLKATFADYTTADLDLERYSHIPEIRRIDLCEPDAFEAYGRYDLIIHSHVMEHLPCNWSAVMIRIHRLLKPEGTHIFSFPIFGSCYSEYLGPMTDDEAKERFGQFDHVRRFSANDLEAMLGALFHLPRSYDLSEDLDAANIPAEARTGFSGRSVFRLKPEALRL